MFGGAGTFAFYGLGALVAAGILALATAIPAWSAALIMAALLGALAGLLALEGKRRIERATPPVPEQAAESVSEDVETVKARAQTGRK
jgi:membrane protein implicated in regulation of membrane protease activity